ncbi:PIR protein [Plasmodium ovale]|uniref:PIR protein n=1 Tax=Plasmodium ovale TaxID=36330 RepID=A0A1D3JBK9_PLAOA|nr:PIR protein [Plasmodium ovale]
MAVEVSFSEKPQSKNCMDEYYETDPDVEKKVNSVKKTDENEDTFLEKCNGLRKYLESYNAQYKRCFNGEAAVFFSYNKDLMNTELARCTIYEKRQEELKRAEKTQITTEGERNGPKTEEENSKKEKLPAEIKGEPVPEGKDATCKSVHLENPKQKCLEGISRGEVESKSEQIALGTSQDESLLHSSLSTTQLQSGNEAHSSTVHTTEDVSLNGVPNVGSKIDKTGTQQNNSLRDIPSFNFQQNSPHNSTNLGDSKTLLTDSPDISATASDPVRSSSSSGSFNYTSITIREPPVHKDHQTNSTTKSSITGDSLSKTSSMKSSPGKSSDDEEVVPISPLLSDAGHSIYGSCLTTADEESNGLSPPSGMPLLPEQLLTHGKSLPDEESPPGESSSSEGLSSDSVQAPPAPQPLHHSQSEEIPVKTYIIIILVILAIILLSILLFRYACMRGYFIKKKKKKRQRIQQELDRIMYSTSIFDEKNMYLSYSRLQNSYYDILYEN